MGETHHNKLVRDKIPEVLEQYGVFGEFHELTEDEYRLALLDKLVEEAKELRESEGLLDERADVEEVLRALDQVYGFTPKKLEKARADKHSDRGGFEKRLYLKKTTE